MCISSSMQILYAKSNAPVSSFWSSKHSLLSPSSPTFFPRHWPHRKSKPTHTPYTYSVRLIDIIGEVHLPVRQIHANFSIIHAASTDATDSKAGRNLIFLINARTAREHNIIQYHQRGPPAISSQASSAPYIQTGVRRQRRGEGSVRQRPSCFEFARCVSRYTGFGVYYMLVVLYMFYDFGLMRVQCTGRAKETRRRYAYINAYFPRNIRRPSKTI